MGDSAQSAAVANSTASQPPQTNYGGEALTAAGGLSSAYAQFAAGQYNRRIGRMNADFARTQATQAEQAGTFAANRLEGRERVVEGADRAAAAAGGTVAGAGTNRAVMASNEAATAMDRMLIELNARRQAYGFRVRAAGDQSTAEMAGRAGDMNAAATLLNAGSQEYLESDPSYTGFRGRGIQFG